MKDLTEESMKDLTEAIRVIGTLVADHTNRRYKAAWIRVKEALMDRPVVCTVKAKPKTDVKTEAGTIRSWVEQHGLSEIVVQNMQETLRRTQAVMLCGMLKEISGKKGF